MHSTMNFKTQIDKNQMRKNAIQQKFKSIDIIFIIILASQLFLATTCLFIASNNIISPVDNMNETIGIIVMIINLGFIASYRFIYQKAALQYSRLNLLEDKLNKFIVLNLVRISIIEFINLINLTAYLITGLYIFFIIFILIFILYFVYRPSRVKFITDFKLSNSEKRQVQESAD